MRNRVLASCALTAAAWAFPSPPLWAQTCDLAGEVEAAATRVLLEDQRKTPNPNAAKQVQAPSGANGGVSPVDLPSLSGLLAAAVDSNLVKLGEQPAVTVTLSPFAFASAFDAGGIDDQAWYERTAWLRRLEGALTLGGKGETLDRDGDGKADPPPATETLSDSVAWELRLRLAGSRDRRETGYGTAFTKAVKEAFLAEVASYHRFITEHGVDCKFVGERLAQPDQALRSELLALARGSEATRQAIQHAADRLDRSFVLTAFASGVRRESALGPDKTGFGLRAGWGRGPLDHTLNADWSRQEADEAGRRPRFVKLGYAATIHPAPTRESDPRLSLFAAWERYKDVPDAKYRTVAKVGGKLELTLAPGISLPLSVTWANHRDLIEGADEFIGHLGISFDLADRRRTKAN